MAQEAIIPLADNTPIYVLGTPDPAKGLKMYRTMNYFIGNILENYIEVAYTHYWESPTGAKVDENKTMTYIVRNSPAVLDPETGAEITPATTSYTDWLEKIIIAGYVGARLGEDIILGAIRQELSTLPYDVESGIIL